MQKGRISYEVIISHKVRARYNVQTRSPVGAGSLTDYIGVVEYLKSHLGRAVACRITDGMRPFALTHLSADT